MLVDSPANRPLRSDLVQSAEEKIKQALKKADLSPRPTYGTPSTSSANVPLNDQADKAESTGHFSRPLSETILAERDIPPEAFKPWMARYVARDAPGTSPSVLYGKFLSPKEKQTSKSTTSHLSLLDKPAGFNPNDPKHRKAWKDQIQSEKLVGRVEGAREGALDYRVGGKGGTESHGRVHGLASLRAWDGLVEERIQVSLVYTSYVAPFIADDPRSIASETGRLVQECTWTWQADCRRPKSAAHGPHRIPLEQDHEAAGREATLDRAAKWWVQRFVAEA